MHGGRMKKTETEKKEQFYVCPRCMELKTYTEISEDCERGGTGLCDCSYVQFEWDAKYQDYEPIYLREYCEYTEITKRLYKALKDFNQADRILYCNIPESEEIKRKNLTLEEVEKRLKKLEAKK